MGCSILPKEVEQGCQPTYNKRSDTMKIIVPDKYRKTFKLLTKQYEIIGIKTEWTNKEHMVFEAPYTLIYKDKITGKQHQLDVSDK